MSKKYICLYGDNRDFYLSVKSIYDMLTLWDDVVICTHSYHFPNNIFSISPYSIESVLTIYQEINDLKKFDFTCIDEQLPFYMMGLTEKEMPYLESYSGNRALELVPHDAMLMMMPWGLEINNYDTLKSFTWNKIDYIKIPSNLRKETRIAYGPSDLIKKSHYNFFETEAEHVWIRELTNLMNLSYDDCIESDDINFRIDNFDILNSSSDLGSV